MCAVYDSVDSVRRQRPSRSRNLLKRWQNLLPIPGDNDEPVGRYRQCQHLDWCRVHNHDDCHRLLGASQARTLQSVVEREKDTGYRRKGAII